MPDKDNEGWQKFFGNLLYCCLNYLVQICLVQNYRSRAKNAFIVTDFTLQGLYMRKNFQLLEHGIILEDLRVA